MRADTNTTNFKLPNFLESGGFVRFYEGGVPCWYVWVGPFQESSVPVMTKTENLLAERALQVQTQGESKYSYNPNKFQIFTSDFFLKNKRFLEPSMVYKWTSSEFKAALGFGADDRQIRDHQKKNTQRTWLAPRKDLFEQSFRLIQEKIYEGEIKKALPVVLSHSPGGLSLQEKLDALLSLVELPEGLYPYGLWTAEAGMMGATPEVLFSLEGRRMTTMALAGTAPTSREDLDFLNDKKESAEHDFVVQHIKEILKPLEAEVVLESRRVLSLPKLKHIQTPIQALFPSSPEFASLTQQMHPTAALGVFPKYFIHSPKISALSWVETLPEQNQRKTHGAPFAVIDERGHALSLVGIRQVFWDQEKSTIGAGCGIVSDSILEKEWNELLLKINSVKGLLGWAD